MRASIYSTGGVIRYPLPVQLVRRGCTYVIPKAEVLRLGAALIKALNETERTHG